MIAIRQEEVTPELKAFIAEGFSRHAVAETGIDGVRDQPVAFAVYNGEELLGAVVILLFWGQLHIKNVYMADKMRGHGMARELMEKAHAYGRRHGCDFAFVETMSFQAEGFYEKLGYHTEFRRDGYAAGTTFIYMRKKLKD